MNRRGYKLSLVKTLDGEFHEAVERRNPPLKNLLKTKSNMTGSYIDSFGCWKITNYMLA
ncbi:MAG: hypothetical protein WCG27_00855 [Pseudomonadota bacterium]